MIAFGFGQSASAAGSPLHISLTDISGAEGVVAGAARRKSLDGYKASCRRRRIFLLTFNSASTTVLGDRRVSFVVPLCSAEYLTDHTRTFHHIVLIFH